MNIEEKRKFRKDILRLHYELSEGNSWNLIMRTKVAERLGSKDHNNDELLGAIKYLEDKGFLTAQTNMEDRITDVGIDEVEGGFPSFATENVGEDSATEGVETVLIELLGEIEDCYRKGEKEILKREKLDNCENLVRTKLAWIILKLNDEELALKLEKLYSGWRTELKSGFHDKKTAVERLGKQKGFIKKVLERISGDIPRSEAFIGAGQTYEGRKTLRLILRQAKQKIWLIDNFMHPDILMVLEPYLTENQELEIRLLTRQNNNSNFRSFKSDLQSFVNQYPQMEIEAKENNLCHGRFIIADDKIYHCGHSFHDLGKKADAITLIQNSKEQKKILNDFDDWWSSEDTIQ